MINRFLFYPSLFIFLVLLQALILNNIQLSGFINPYLYILFIIWLPIDMPKGLVMLISFALGLSIDIFSNTYGMHASASVFLAFLRPYVLNIMAPRDGYESNQNIGINDFGILWFLVFASILTLAHHLFLFFVEVFRFNDFFSTLGRAILSTIITLILILISQLFRYKPKSN